MGSGHISGRQGQLSDLGCLQEEAWLLDAAVRYHIALRRGRYWVSLVYIDTGNPFRIRIRQIDHYPTLRKAEQYAELLKRGVQRDQRGTLKVNTDAFDICNN